MKRAVKIVNLVFMLSVIVSCNQSHEHGHGHAEHNAHGEVEHEEVLKGPHGGRLLVDEKFSLELAIFETGVPPEYRVWATKAGKPVAPEDVELSITLMRLGGVKDHIAFYPQNDFLRGDTVIYEPHSFIVTVEAKHANAMHRWEYDNFEGRTQIGPEVAEAFDLKTEVAGPATIRETITVYGKVEPDAEKVRQVHARFAGTIESVAVSVGEQVRQGQTLATVESNESLTRYTIKAPIDGVITERNARAGEQTGDQLLFSLMDTTSVWIEFAIFPRDLSRVRKGAPVRINMPDSEPSRIGNIDYIGVMARPDQSITARASLDNTDGALLPGMFVTGDIQIAEHQVPLAVKRAGLQAFRDFTVVYAKIEDQYEVRMLDLGRQDSEWVEVLGGLKHGTRYVTANSYLVKADIEKSGASHDH